MPRVTTQSVIPSDERLLFDALRDTPNAWEGLFTRFEPYLLSIAQSRLADLPCDIHEDFVQEVWKRVAGCSPDDFDPRAEAARSFVARFVSAAVNAVRANYRAPGQRSRDRTAYDGAVPLSEVVQLRDGRADRDFLIVEARVTLMRLMSVASKRLRQGLELMLAEDISPTEAARRIGMPRETFRRQMTELPALLRRRGRGRSSPRLSMASPRSPSGPPPQSGRRSKPVASSAVNRYAASRPRSLRTTGGGIRRGPG